MPDLFHAPLSPTLAAVALFDVLLVVLGFSLIIVIHELGHFLAARWAGIRVLAFAVGFGPALFSYRKGLGWRQGSSEREYERLKAESAAALDTPAPTQPISPTEYRLNALPFGGYVKMLGQEDANPSAESKEPDSYGQAPIWKRMIVISAGVVMNILLAALLFVVVYAVGLRIEPARIGYVAPGSPAARAIALNASSAGLMHPGLQPGDLVTEIDGRATRSFKDVALASLMARPGRPLTVEVERRGIDRPLTFAITPEQDPFTKTLQLGIAPGYSNRLAPNIDDFEHIAQRLGLRGVRPGMVMTQVNREPAERYADLHLAAAASNGAPFSVTFADEKEVYQLTQLPVPAMQTSLFQIDDAGTLAAVEHLFGVVPVMSVGAVHKDATTDKLRAGDVFAQVGDAEWPSVVEGMAQIRAQAGGTVSIRVLREKPGATEEFEVVNLGPVHVTPQGTIGFRPDDTGPGRLILANWPVLVPLDRKESPSAAALRIPAGDTLAAVNDTTVSSLPELREALKSLASGLPAGEPLTVTLTVNDEDRKPRTIEWTIPAEEVTALKELGWESPIPGELFIPEEIILKETNPLAAIGVGLHETRRILLTTYLTFVRLYQGSVKVEHLKGPVGIAHTGAIVAQRGYVWLLFFLAMVSVNLAVVNFLPIPIADGGHFLMLLYEQITGRPVSIIVQNVLTMAGLGFIVILFLIVTFNDVANLFR